MLEILFRLKKDQETDYSKRQGPYLTPDDYKTFPDEEKRWWQWRKDDSHFSVARFRDCLHVIFIGTLVTWVGSAYLLRSSSELFGVARTIPFYVRRFAGAGVVGGGIVIFSYGVWRALVITLPEEFYEGLVSKYVWASKKYDYVVKPLSVVAIGVGILFLTITALIFPLIVIVYFYYLFRELLGF